MCHFIKTTTKCKTCDRELYEYTDPSTACKQVNRSGAKWGECGRPQEKESSVTRDRVCKQCKERKKDDQIDEARKANVE